MPARFMSSNSLSIVILNYNTSALLRACLASIRQYAPEADVIVVDNASTDDSIAVVRQQFPTVRLLANPVNAGFARGMNQGLQVAQAPLRLALNADTELLPTTLPPLLRALAEHPRTGIVGPAQYVPEAARPGQPGAPLASAFPDPTLASEARRLLLFADTLAARFKRGPWRPPAGPPRRVDWLMGAALLFRRECLEAVTGFDETEFMYGEDWDICFRARQAGWEVCLVPEAPILHHANAAGRQHFGAQRQARVFQANLYFHEKHFGRASRQRLACIYLLGAYLRLALLLPGRLAGFFTARWQGLQAEAGAAWKEIYASASPERPRP